MIKVWFFAILYFIAGVAHLLSPEKFLFLLPAWTPAPLILVIMTGVFELLLVVGLCLKKWRSLTGYVSAAYLLLLNFSHLYVAVEGVPMFGISSPWFLWGRFFFQFVLIFWSYKIGTRLNHADKFWQQP